jgi:flagellar biosynthesis protein FliP
MVIVLGALALAPFVVIMFTSFVKISVVLSILRNALGTQQVPPSQVITGLAFVLTIFVMAPVARQMYADAGDVSNTRDIFSEASVKSVFDASKKAREPLRRFLAQHSKVKDRELFIDLAMRLERNAQAQRQPGPRPGSRPAAQPVVAPQPATTPRTLQASFVPVVQASTPPAQATAPPATAAPPPASPQTDAIKVDKPDKNDFQVLMPAFVTSQLKEAFEVGFLLFIPFIVVDMVVANILLAMGMQMLSPTVISLPFKLLLFVLVDGWFLIVRGLVLSYT